MRTIETGGKFRRWLAWWLRERRRERRAVAAVVVTVPNPPTSFTASPITGGASLTWADASTDETGFRIYRKLYGGPSFTALVEVSANTTSYNDYAVELGNLYTYVVRAFNAAGESASTVERHVEIAGEGE